MQKRSLQRVIFFISNDSQHTHYGKTV